MKKALTNTRVSVKLRKSEYREECPATRRRNRHLYGQQNAWSYECPYNSNLCQGR